MKYFIDSADRCQIDHCLSLGIQGVTANPTMYKNCQENFYEFLTYYSQKNCEFLSAEVMGDTVEEMLEEAKKIHEIDPKIVIKINFSQAGLQACHQLSQENITCAMTLVFTIPQAIAAMQAGAAYIFAFIGRNDEYGSDGLQFICDLQDIVEHKQYSTKIVAASIKNLHQLDVIACAGIDYAAIPYALYLKSLQHPLTESGAQTFKEDWKHVQK